ncbi:MAG: ABC transporter permease [Bacteroidales bacterium]|nr:ABC transporter permease [Bacteroidales bacterium]
MIRNYITSAFRNIIKNKFYSFLNILGLSVGLTAFIFLFLHISDEMSYDAYHENAPRIHRIESNFTIAGKNEMFAIVPVPMGPALQLEFPEVEAVNRIFGAGNTLFRNDEKESYEEDFYFTDSTFFQVFTHNMILGDPDKCLVEPLSIVLTKSIAEKYFGDKDPMGMILESGTGRQYKVTGVMEDVPANSHLKFDALISGTTLAAEAGEEEFNSMEPVRFWNIGVYTYIMLNENSEIQAIHDKFPGFYEKYMKAIGDQINASFELMSTPLAEQHFSEHLASDFPKGNRAFIFIFIAVALFILLIAAINYMNMATARSTKRAREVGIRKVAGAQKSQLIGQFLGESLLLSYISLVIAVLFVYLLMPDFNTLSGKSITTDIFMNPVYIIGIIIVATFIGFISGSYPAFYLSSFKPVTVVKGSVSGMGGSGLLRKILVVFQFFIATAMIIGAIIVSQQLNYLKNKDLGFDMEHMMILEMQDTNFRAKAPMFREELLQNPDILGVTNSIGVPGANNWIQVVRMEKDTNWIDESSMITIVDYHYFDVYNIHFKEGRPFDENMGTDDSAAVVVNEALVKAYGWEDDPIGKTIHWGFGLDGEEGRKMKVIGVIEDYHFKSLHNLVQPQMIFPAEFDKFHLSVRINGDNMRETIDFIEEKWNDFGANRPFNYRFLEETWDEMYTAEKKLGVIFSIATILTIFIALLGLLGLSSFIAEQRTKEIGIRKILGASMNSIVNLLYKDFAILIGIAFVLAIPVAWYMLDLWLENFAFHIQIGVFAFILGGVLSLAVGMLSISFHILKVASSNPVNAIKYE